MLLVGVIIPINGKFILNELQNVSFSGLVLNGNLSFN